MKVHLDTGNIYYNNWNMRESIYSFMDAQQDETKKFIDFDLDMIDDFEFYLNEVIACVTDDKFDIDTYSTRSLGSKTYYCFGCSTCPRKSTE